MKTYAGKCKGGPWNGQQFAHYSQTKEFFEPVIRGLPICLENAEVIASKIGEYYWGANGFVDMAPGRQQVAPCLQLDEW